jgi:hypothetical protein
MFIALFTFYAYFSMKMLTEKVPQQRAGYHLVYRTRVQINASLCGTENLPAKFITRHVVKTRVYQPGGPSDLCVPLKICGRRGRQNSLEASSERLPSSSPLEHTRFGSSARRRVPFLRLLAPIPPSFFYPWLPQVFGYSLHPNLWIHAENFVTTIPRCYFFPRKKRTSFHIQYGVMGSPPPPRTVGCRNHERRRLAARKKPSPSPLSWLSSFVQANPHLPSRPSALADPPLD